jgi:hypothetical protein
MQAITGIRVFRVRSFRAQLCVMLGALVLAVGASANPPRTYGNLTVNPMFTTFQKEAVGATSAPSTVTLTNNSSGAVSITAVQSSIAEFSYAGPSLPVTLSAHQSWQALVTFSPVAARQYYGVMTFTLSTGSRSMVELSGSGTNATVPPTSATMPAITSNPTSQTVTAGQTATFMVAATGTAPMTYQWRMNGSSIGGATSASFTTAATTTASSGETFSVAVSNSAGSATSGSAALTVNPAATAPAITSNPTSQTVLAGKTATFSVVAGGTAPMTYQWSMNGTAISGATSASYTTAATTAANSGETFSASVSNSAGSATSSSATLTVNPAVTAPTVTSNPVSQTVIAGKTATFSVVATGSAPMTYQWSMNGTAISGATSASYTTSATTTANSGETFSASVSNSAGSATSGNATLTVNPVVTSPAITSNPTNQTVIAGQTATFFVAASGTAPLTYQWSMNGTAISGATSLSYTTAATTTANSGETFSVAVSNSAGSATSSSATLIVNPVATRLLSSNPSSLSFGNVSMGSSGNLTVTLTNSGNSSVTVSNVGIAGSGFAPSGVSTGQILAPGTTTMSVAFTPAEAASVTGTVTITSNATNSPTTISLSGTGTQVAYSVGLSWSPSSSSSIAGYNVYRSTTSGGESQTNPINGGTLIAGENYIDANVAAGTTYYYVVTTVGTDKVQSTDSTEVSALVP